jgi:FkbM family methyltransferase
MIMQTFEKTKDIARKLLPDRVWAIVRLLWARFSFGTFKRRIVRHRYDRHEFYFELIDFDGARWYDHDYEEFPEIALLGQHRLAAGARVFNAGANQCLQAMVMAKQVGTDGFVWAIEPIEQNARAARRNIELNGIANCCVIEAAVSDRPGRIMINRSMNGQISLDKRGVGRRAVRAVSIDALTEELGAPDVLYIDIEGFECAALEGARVTLVRHVPDCFVEVHSGYGLEKLGGSVAKVVSFFPPAAYRVLYGNGRDNVFHELNSTADLPRGRFFLLALARENIRLSTGHATGERSGTRIVPEPTPKSRLERRLQPRFAAPHRQTLHNGRGSEVIPNG